MSINFENGVYDAVTDTFHECSVDSRHQLNTGYPWQDPSPEDFSEVNRILETTFLDPKVREIFKQSVGRLLNPDTRGRDLTVWLGEACNGKSTVMSLLQASLGDYITRVPVSDLLEGSKRTRGQAGVRMGVIDEPEDNVLFDVDLLKKASDSCQLTFIANSLANVPTNAQFTVIPFNTTFKSITVKYDSPLIRPLDPTIHTRILRLRMAFFNVLREAYGLIRTEEVHD